MVRNLPSRPLVESASKDKQAPEDSSMKDGIFNEDNTKPPIEQSVMRLFSLKGKTAIVSGSGAGIGLAVVKGFAEAGANVAIWYHSNKEALDRAKEIEETYDVKCKAYQTDITSFDDTKKVINEITHDFNGRLDIFVANAGIPWTQGRMIDGELSAYHKVVSTDLDSVFYCAKAAGEIFRKQYENGGVNMMGEKMQNYSYGSFIATASMSGHIANIPQLQAAVSFSSALSSSASHTLTRKQYNAAKAGVIHLCKSLAVEWVKFARVNSVSPGYMATEISDFVPPEIKRIWHGKIPMGREGEASELKGAYLFLASDASSYMTGADMVVDGGYCSV